MPGKLARDLGECLRPDPLAVSALPGRGGV